MMRLTSIATLLLLSGCTGSLLESKIPVPTIYVLAAAPAASPTTSALPVDIAVSQPTIAPGLDTDRIAILLESRRLDYYREAQWGAALPQVAQSLVVGSLQNHQFFRSVTTEQARVTTHFLLDLEVRNFQAEYASEGAAPIVRVTLVASLIRIKDRKLVGIVPATATVQASANRLSAVIQAFESAGQQAAVSLGKQAASVIQVNSTN